ncbi:MAG TPA: TetR/AcrR family transcriptional regulator [Amaricoccus sp.]|nr:TetR/AcrR family transcriptional regulator [Amaricoccus sp.]
MRGMADSDPEPRKSYHHGNLRQALAEAALRLIEEKGPLGFTLAEAARAAGVSPAAPYRHFRGREELIEEVARQGFVMFADALERAAAAGGPSALRALFEIGRAYLEFARSHPGYYQAMFESGVEVAGNGELARAAERALSVLIGVAARLAAQLPPERRPPPTMVANHVWALSHGVVELFGRGRPGSRAPYSAEEMLESGVSIYLRGLGVIPA